MQRDKKAHKRNLFKVFPIFSQFFLIFLCAVLILFFLCDFLRCRVKQVYVIKVYVLFSSQKDGQDENHGKPKKTYKENKRGATPPVFLRLYCRFSLVFILIILLFIPVFILEAVNIAMCRPRGAKFGFCQEKIRNTQRNK